MELVDGGALGAEGALVDGRVGIALDVDDGAILDIDQRVAADGAVGDRRWGIAWPRRYAATRRAPGPDAGRGRARPCRPGRSRRGCAPETSGGNGRRCPWFPPDSGSVRAPLAREVRRKASPRAALNCGRKGSTEKERVKEGEVRHQPATNDPQASGGAAPDAWAAGKQDRIEIEATEITRLVPFRYAWRVHERGMTTRRAAAPRDMSQRVSSPWLVGTASAGPRPVDIDADA